jgi:hypothetical protein
MLHPRVPSLKLRTTLKTMTVSDSNEEIFSRHPSRGHKLNGQMNSAPAKGNGKQKAPNVEPTAEKHKHSTTTEDMPPVSLVII